MHQQVSEYIESCQSQDACWLHAEWTRTPSGKSRAERGIIWLAVSQGEMQVMAQVDCRGAACCAHIRDRPPRVSRAGSVKCPCERSEAIFTPGQWQDEYWIAFPRNAGLSSSQ